MDFYKQKNTKDGRFGICILCKCKKSREAYLRIKADPVLLAKERKRGREKAARLNYAEKYKAKTLEQQKRINEIKYEWIRRNPQKRKAHNLLNSALRCKRIEKQPCIVCGKKEAEAHHDDYSKPLEVKWLCRKHHAELHHVPFA